MEDKKELERHWFGTVARLLTKKVSDAKMAGGGFEGPSPLIALGFEETMSGLSWTKKFDNSVETDDGVPVELIVSYYPDSQTWVQRPGFNTAAGQTISRWGAKVFNIDVAKVRSDETQMHNLILARELGDLFDIASQESGYNIS